LAQLREACAKVGLGFGLVGVSWGAEGKEW